MTPVTELPAALQAHLAGRNLIVFDGTCILCSAHFWFVLRHDRGGVFHFATAQSEVGQALYIALDLPTMDFETNLVILNNEIFQDMEAVAAALHGLGWPWAALGLIRFLPRAIKRRLYRLIARNRYALFGKAEHCLIPDPDMRARFVTNGWSAPNEQANHSPAVATLT